MAKLTYETGIATLIQFVIVSILGFFNGATSVVTGCTNDSGDCTSNLLVTMIFVLVTAIWFFCVWGLGYMAQEKRSPLLAKLLIVAELGIAVIAYFNIKHHVDVLSLVSSVVDLGLTVWVIVLAVRLNKTGGKRIAPAQRPRQRRRSPSKPISKLPVE